MPIIQALKVTEESRNSVALSYNAYRQPEDKITKDHPMVLENLGGYFVRVAYQPGSFVTAKEFLERYVVIGEDNYPWLTNVGEISKEGDPIQNTLFVADLDEVEANDISDQEDDRPYDVVNGKVVYLTQIEENDDQEDNE